MLITHATDYAGRVLKRHDTVTHRPDARRFVRGVVQALERDAAGHSHATLATADGLASWPTNDLALYS